MPAALYPSVNDTSENVLWYKIAYDLFIWAQDNGITGLNPPYVGEQAFSLKKKAAYYAAALEEVLV